MKTLKNIKTVIFILFIIFMASSSFAKPTGGIPARDIFVVEIVSSAPHQVTGGDARIHIQVPRTVPLHQVEVLVNGIEVLTNAATSFKSLGREH